MLGEVKADLFNISHTLGDKMTLLLVLSGIIVFPGSALKQSAFCHV